MKTILLYNKRLQITAQEERALRIIRKKNFVARKDDFKERKGRGNYKSILPTDPQIGISLEPNWRGQFKQSTRAEKFFAHNPLCRHAVIGNVRRVNTILDKIESGDFG
jgi:hypothetical protein